MNYLTHADSNQKFSLNNHIDDTVVIETFPTERKFDELKINYKDFNDIAKKTVIAYETGSDVAFLNNLDNKYT